MGTTHTTHVCKRLLVGLLLMLAVVKSTRKFPVVSLLVTIRFALHVAKLGAKCLSGLNSA